MISIQLLGQVSKNNPYWKNQIVRFLANTKVDESGAIDEDIFDYHCCIVGELHGFSNDYAVFENDGYCNICESIGNDLSYYFNDDLHKDRFESTLVQLYDHMKKPHKHSNEDDE